MTNEQKKQLLLYLIKIEEDGEIFNFTRAERAEFQKWVDRLIDQESPWIPVSERLPEETAKVLVQAEDVYYNIGENSNGIIMGWRNGQYWSTYTVKGIEFIKYPVAWMPLPQRYKAESEEDNV